MIVSLPRTGSTALAQLLSCDARVRCIVEPFHPFRYGGRYHACATNQSLEEALNLIWSEWNSFKHVWDMKGFPFFKRPQLNSDVLYTAACKVVLLTRRNILRRLVSQHLSRKTQTWIGPREAFIARLRTTNVAPLDPSDVRREIQDELTALAEQRRLLSNHHVEFMELEYENLFSDSVAAHEQHSLLNEVLTFVGLGSVQDNTIVARWAEILDPSRHQWAAPDVYRRIPGIDHLDETVGDDATGWLFR